MSELPKWLWLLRIARSLIQQVNSKQSIIEHWTFGGGTAMMIQIDHRESNDIDIFLPDPQLLPFLDPQKHDFRFEIQPDDYRSDGIRSLKLAFNQIGQIDFIVAGALRRRPQRRPMLMVKLFSWRRSLRSLRRKFTIALQASKHATF